MVLMEQCIYIYIYMQRACTMLTIEGLGKLLEVYGFFKDGVGLPSSPRRAVWSKNAARAWGTLLIAYDLVENTAAEVYTHPEHSDNGRGRRNQPDYSSPGISDNPVALLKGVPTDVEQYRRVIRRQGPTVGLFNVSLSAAGWQLDPRAVLIRNANTAHRGEMHRLLDAMIESAARAVPYLIKSIISTDDREALRWVSCTG